MDVDPSWTLSGSSNVMPVRPMEAMDDVADIFLMVDVDELASPQELMVLEEDEDAFIGLSAVSHQ